MGLIGWWKKMKETYGDLPPSQAFNRGQIDGQVLSLRAREERKRIKLERRKGR